MILNILKKFLLIENSQTSLNEDYGEESPFWLKLNNSLYSLAVSGCK